MRASVSMFRSVGGEPRGARGGLSLRMLAAAGVRRRAGAPNAATQQRKGNSEQIRQQERVNERSRVRAFGQKRSMEMRRSFVHETLLDNVFTFEWGWNSPSGSAHTRSS